MTDPFELLRELVEIESPTYSEGVRAVAGRMARELEELGGETRFLDGNHLQAELAGEGERLLLLGHTDTVWPVGTLASMPFRVEDGRAYGPGTYDMKGCLVVLVEAIRRAGPARRALRVFLTPTRRWEAAPGGRTLRRPRTAPPPRWWSSRPARRAT